MDNILEQIQSLTDKFNNLFEVEGLGEPSGDVPPSTNKIKKDKKTKDGKVELVSVEDELFPKEGNAKEQFRQKIIDKINGMIQGTATLEDLLQLVRSKQIKPVKEGFEGAIEILTNLLEGRKEGESLEDFKQRLAREQADKQYNKHVDNLEKAIYSEQHDKKHKIKDVLTHGSRTRKFRNKAEKHYDNFVKASNVQAKDAGFTPLKRTPSAIKNNVDDNYANLKAEMRDDNKVKEGFEGAIEILEQLLSERINPDGNDDVRREGIKRELQGMLDDLVAKGIAQGLEMHPEDKANLYNNNPKGRDMVKRYKSMFRESSRRRISEKKCFENAIKLLENIIAERKYSEEEIREIAKKVRPERAKQFSKACDDLEKATGGKNPDKFTTVQKYRANKAAEKVERTQDRLNHVDDIINPPVKTPTGTKRTNESFEQAISILEKLISEEKTSTNDYHEKKAKIKKAIENKHPDILKLYPSGVDPIAQEERAKLEGSWEKAQNKQHQQDEKRGIGKGRLWNPTKNDKGDYKTRERSQIENGGFRYKSHDDTVKASIARHNKKVANESFEQAISQIEDLINYLGESKSSDELSSVAKRVLPQREANAEKAHAEVNRVTHLNPYNMINGKISQKQREVIANALNKAEKADSKVAKAKSYLEKPKEKQQTGIKFDRILCSHEANESLAELEKEVAKEVDKFSSKPIDRKKVEANKKLYDINNLDSYARREAIYNAKLRKAQEANEALQEAIAILELFDRPDLIDDILKAVTGKTVKQHLQNKVKKIIKGKKKKES